MNYEPVCNPDFTYVIHHYYQSNCVRIAGFVRSFYVRMVMNRGKSVC